MEIEIENGDNKEMQKNGKEDNKIESETNIEGHKNLQENSSSTSPKKEKQEKNKNIKPTSDSDLKEKNDKIELYLKKKFGKINPTLYIEYPKNKDMSPLSKLDLENIRIILNKFGKINFIEIFYLICFVQYDSFLSAYSCIKYFEKICKNKEDKIICRWFEEKDEETVTEDILSKTKKLKPYEIVDNINKSMKNYYMKKKEKNNEFSDMQEEEENDEKENILTDVINHLEYYSTFCLTPKAQKEFNEIVSLNKTRGFKNMEFSCYIASKDSNLNNMNQPNVNNNEKSNIKYICKFYLQIEGDKEFQVIKRIIGAKGSNLKRIIDYCSKGPGGVYIPDAIKLKLKGVGSGYREKVGDKKEPLNLCVISTYQDKYKKACSFVIELIINIYEEYKRFCERKKKTPISNLNIQKVEYISTRGC